jgi:capsular polysaccharide transport system ATP-binding protein
MIQITNVCKRYPSRHGITTIFEDVNLTVNRGEHVGILGRNGAGKSTLVRLISGAEQPTQGKITRTMSVSWPLAFGGAFQSTLTGIDNLRFICRVYGVDYQDKIAAVDSFSELGKYLWEPVRVYSSGMRARLAFGISMAIDFDCFLIDEVVAVGDVRFQQKCHEELFLKRSANAMVIVSHDADFIKAYCQKAYVISERRIIGFEDLDLAYHFYHQGHV